MIVSTLSQSSRIESLHPLFHQLFAYVKTHNLLDAPCGRIELDGNMLFINRCDVEGVDASNQVLEVHRDYIDIHILLAGEETIGWKPLEDVRNEKQAYQQEGDCALYDERASTYVTLQPGQFAIVWPEDCHAPVIGKGCIRKLIAKVKL